MRVELTADDNDRMTDVEKQEFISSHGIPDEGVSLECTWRGDQMVWVYYWSEA